MHKYNARMYKYNARMHKYNVCMYKYNECRRMVACTVHNVYRDKVHIVIYLNCTGVPQYEWKLESIGKLDKITLKRLESVRHPPSLDSLKTKYSCLKSTLIKCYYIKLT